jgi:hypothetical protein
MPDNSRILGLDLSTVTSTDFTSKLNNACVRGIQVGSTYPVFADSVGGELLRVGSNAVLGPCAFRWSSAVSRGGGVCAPGSRAPGSVLWRRMEGRGVAGGCGRRAPPESLGRGVGRSSPRSLLPWPSARRCQWRGFVGGCP